MAVHEIGHVLGQEHTNKSGSIMYALYHATKVEPRFELGVDDRREVQRIHGTTNTWSPDKLVTFEWQRIAEKRAI